MQRNPGYPSIEGELEKAICNAGGISEANAESFTKVGAFVVVLHSQRINCCMISTSYVSLTVTAPMLITDSAHLLLVGI